MFSGKSNNKEIRESNNLLCYCNKHQSLHYTKASFFSVLPSRTNFLKGELGQLLKELDVTGRGDVHFRVAADRLKNNADSIQVSQSLSFKS